MRSAIVICLCLSTIGFSGCQPPPAPIVTNGVEPDERERERVRAEPGVGRQGQIIGDREGILRTPAKAYFTTRQRIVFEIQIPHALNLYIAEHGTHPQTEEEFMSRIIEFNRIELPELPEGHRYIWDSEAGELMVERPAGEPGRGGS